MKCKWCGKEAEKQNVIVESNQNSNNVNVLEKKVIPFCSDNCQKNYQYSAECM